MPGISGNLVSQTEWIEQGQASLLSPHPLFQWIFRPKVLSLSLLPSVTCSLSFSAALPQLFPDIPLFSQYFTVFSLSIRAYKSPWHNTHQKLLIPHVLLMRHLKVVAAFTSKKKPLFFHKASQIHIINRFHWGSYFLSLRHWWKRRMRLVPRLIPKDLQK